MKVVTICVASIEETQRRLAAACAGVPQEPRIAFASFDLLLKVLTPKRWELLQEMMGQGPMGIRELARRAHRDVANVHADIEALAKAGVIRRGDEGIEFPYDAARLDVLLTAA